MTEFTKLYAFVCRYNQEYLVMARDMKNIPVVEIHSRKGPNLNYKSIHLYAGFTAILAQMQRMSNFQTFINTTREITLEKKTVPWVIVASTMEKGIDFQPSFFCYAHTFHQRG